MPELDPNASNVRVFYLLELDAIFRELIQHPAAVDMVREVVGRDFMISNFTAEHRPAGVEVDGAPFGPLSGDAVEPWIRTPWSVNIIWCLSDACVREWRHPIHPRQPSLAYTRADVPPDANARC